LNGLRDCMRNATLSVKVVLFHAIKTCQGVGTQLYLLNERGAILRLECTY
jgi:hypothetical protein